MPDVVDRTDANHRDEFPEFDYSYRFDDPTKPTQVTIFEHGPDISTHWLTVDIGTVVGVEELR